MLNLPFNDTSLKRARFRLRTAYPQVRAAHIAEGLAAALGFGSAVAMSNACRKALPGAGMEADAAAFVSRLARLRHVVPVAEAGTALREVASAEAATPEGHFALLVSLVHRSVRDGDRELRLGLTPMGWGYSVRRGNAIWSSPGIEADRVAGMIRSSDKLMEAVGDVAIGIIRSDGDQGDPFLIVRFPYAEKVPDRGIAVAAATL